MSGTGWVVGEGGRGKGVVSVAGVGGEGLETSNFIEVRLFIVPFA